MQKGPGQHLYILGTSILKTLKGVFSFCSFPSFVDHINGKAAQNNNTNTFQKEFSTTRLCNGLLGGGGLKNNFSKGNYKGKTDCSFPVWKVSREIPESWKIHWDCFSDCVSGLHLV